jgi:ATP/maltotriose-dependent transcriptional regulator MalT
MTGMSAAELRGGCGPAGLIGRNDPVATLHCAVRKRVTIISGPVGSGKTSLLHAWADWPGQDRQITITKIR